MATKFCRANSSTLPIITNNHSNAVLRQFIEDYSSATAVNGTSRLITAWLGVRARNDNDTAKWFWLDGRPSGN